MAFKFLPVTTNYVGSAGNNLGNMGADVAKYPIVWNPVTRRAESDDPNYAGYNRRGILNVPRGTRTNTVSTGLPPIFASVAAPQAQAAQGASPVYPLNIPTGSAVSKVSVPRSDNVTGAVNPMFTDLAALKDSVNKTLAEFKTQFPEWLSGQQATAATESAATSGLFTGEAQARSDANAANFLTQANAANAKSIADVQRLTSRSALASDASGYSSARDRGRFATIAGINANAGRDAAVAKMAADQWLTQLQQQMSGAQAARGRLAIGDTLMPATVESQSFENILRNLAGLSGVEQGNLMTGLVGPGGYLGDSFGGLQSAKLQDLMRILEGQVSADKSAFNWTRRNDILTAPPQLTPSDDEQYDSYGKAPTVRQPAVRTNWI